MTAFRAPKSLKALTVAGGLVAALALAPLPAQAHCDTLDGPVVGEARIALDRGDITPVLKWISADDEKLVRAAFAQTLAVRKQSPEARELADHYFFETLVRIHRAGEGAPYTGLKPGVAVDPAVALADQALATGSADKLAKTLTGALDKGIRERYVAAAEAKKHADDDVAAGREFVESYVVFTHYVEGLHGQIAGAGTHHGAPAEQEAKAEHAH
jgi:hypothetical protein